MRAPIEFTITDHSGTPHEYVVPLFSVDEGLALFGQIMALFSGPIAAALDERGAGKALGEHLRDTLMGGAPPKLLLALVGQASRDGKPLRDKVNRDDAFAGNYAELYAAAWKIVVGNGWLPPAFMSAIESELTKTALKHLTASDSDVAA